MFGADVPSYAYRIKTLASKLDSIITKISITWTLINGIESHNYNNNKNNVNNTNAALFRAVACQRHHL